MTIDKKAVLCFHLPFKPDSTYKTCRCYPVLMLLALASILILPAVAFSQTDNSYLIDLDEVRIKGRKDAYQVFDLTKEAQRFHSIILPTENVGFFIPMEFVRKGANDVLMEFGYTLLGASTKKLLVSSYLVDEDKTVIKIDSTLKQLESRYRKTKLKIKVPVNFNTEEKIIGLLISISNTHFEDASTLSIDYSSRYRSFFTYEIISGKMVPKDIRSRFATFGKRVWQHRVPNWAVKIILEK